MGLTNYGGVDMKCAKCGSEVAADGKFCPGCGAPVQQAQSNRKSDEIDYVIIGDDIQAVKITLDPGEGVRSEAGAMCYMEDGIDMSTGATGGMWKGLKRMFTGESFFQTTFTNNGTNRAEVAFSAPYPGKIVPLDMSQWGEFICQKESFLCSANGIDLDIAFTKRLGTGFFGGEGFILQRISGDGMAFIQAGGTVITRDLKPNETLRVDTGCIVGFQSSVSYEIKFVGGFKNALFGGEGMFFAVLRGPGRVFLQTMPFSRLADRIVMASSYVKSAGGTTGGESAAGSILGALGGIIGNRE